MFNWIKDKYNQFQDWLSSVIPGWKVKIVAILGVIGSAAAYTQEWFTGLPLTHWVSAEAVSLIDAGLFSLAYWFRNLTDRSE